VALAEASRGRGSVLVGDTGGPSGAIACYTGVEAPRSLVEVAEHVAPGLPAGQLVAITREGLRVLATGPRFTPECARAGVELLLDHARARYGLTVIDCGTVAREADQVALERATHVAWVLPATVGGARRARRVLEAINPYRLGGELIVARHDERERKAPLSELKRLAERRHATLVLLPTLPDLATGNTTAALNTAQVSLQAIQGVLAR
jgi:Flp pilus assembly CpaE family ATPase